MWIYTKMTQRPVEVSGKDVRMAKLVLDAYGGKDGELGASTRYLTQRYCMPIKEGKAILTDVGTEELGHMEMVGAIFEQLTRGATKQEMTDAGFDAYFTSNGCNPFYVDPSGVAFSEYAIGSNGNPVADLTEDMAAEQKARITYENLLKFTDDPLLRGTLKFLREREVVHFQRFGEALRLVNEHYDTKKYF